MTKILIAIGLVVVALVVAIVLYGAWFLRNSVGDTTRVSTHIKPSADTTVEIEVSTTGARSPVTVTEISMPRALRDELGLKPPHGFVAEPLPLTADEQKDPEAVARATEFNRQKVRFTGALAVPPNGSSVLVFRVERKGGAGTIDLQFERKAGMGGSITFGSVKLGDTNAGR